MVGVHWVFRAFFFIVVLAATIAVGLVVLATQGVYAALLLISLPIGALGFVKARCCPLVVKDRGPGKASSPDRVEKVL